MSNINFIRWSGAAGFIGGFITIVGAFLTEPFTGQYLIGGLLIILALVGVLLVLWQTGAGRWGLSGILAALIGHLFFAIEQIPVFAGLSYGLGLVLLAIGAWKIGVIPRWLPVLWIAAPLVGVPGLFLESSAEFLTTLATVIFGLAFIGTGYALWKIRSADGIEVETI